MLTAASITLGSQPSFAALCINFHYADEAPIRCGCAKGRFRETPNVPLERSIQSLERISPADWILENLWPIVL